MKINNQSFHNCSILTQEFVSCFTDRLGTPQKLMSQAGTQLAEYSYSPWGKPRNPATLQAYDPSVKDWDNLQVSWFHRGFTGHEMLFGVNLINMNGRVYDPYTCRFLSPDPYVQAPDFTQNYNRYSYCYNNPLIYTDPTGKYAVVDDIIAAVIGGVINLAVNAYQGNLSGHGLWGGIGRGLAAFGAGAVGGWGALYPEFGGWIWGGATVGATNAWLGEATTGTEIAIGATIGAFSGVIGGAAGQWGSQFIGSVVINGTNITSPVLQGVITGSAGGAFGGYAGGFTSGLIMTGDLQQANQAGLNGLLTGIAVGGAIGAGAGYKYAIDNEINPWNGNLKFAQTQHYDFTPNQYGDNEVLYRGMTGSEGNEGPIFFTTDPEYAATYCKNGYGVQEITLPRGTLFQMQQNGALQINPNGVHQINGQTYYGNEYMFNNTVRVQLVPRLR